jgi:UDP-2-acetamido-2,6-beta-L-arabino-hexul-4-ose reductase
MAILVTGARGFIGKNLALHLAARGHTVIEISSDATEAELGAAIDRAELVFHLAGVNRPTRDDEFVSGNIDFTRTLCELLSASGRLIPVVFSSSIQADRENAYGRSKRAAEELLLAYAATGAPVRIFRLPNVFGKWARPNYNSAIATFCHNAARGMAFDVHDPAASLRLAYVEDVCSAFLALAEQTFRGSAFAEVEPVYQATVGEVADMIRGFAASRETMVSDRVGAGLTRALYSTYVSYLEPASFAYHVPLHSDDRGVFVEMLKTPDCGQFSYFTARPGVTRGQHYHHTKTEKFLVLTGRARFGFRHMVTGETLHLEVGGGQGRIVETVPGWTHDITNVGDTEMVVMLWANEIFDRDRPDTISMKV